VQTRVGKKRGKKAFRRERGEKIEGRAPHAVAFANFTPDGKLSRRGKNTKVWAPCSRRDPASAKDEKEKKPSEGGDRGRDCLSSLQLIRRKEEKGLLEKKRPASRDHAHLIPNCRSRNRGSPGRGGGGKIVPKNDVTHLEYLLISLFSRTSSQAERRREKGKKEGSSWRKEKRRNRREIWRVPMSTISFFLPFPSSRRRHRRERKEIYVGGGRGRGGGGGGGEGTLEEEGGEAHGKNPLPGGRFSGVKRNNRAASSFFLPLTAAIRQREKKEGEIPRREREASMSDAGLPLISNYTLSFLFSSVIPIFAISLPNCREKINYQEGPKAHRAAAHHSPLPYHLALSTQRGKKKRKAREGKEQAGKSLSSYYFPYPVNPGERRP